MTAKEQRYQSDGLKVFLCHRSEDKPRIRQLQERLNDDGFWPWLDADALHPGDRWEDMIVSAIREADAVLICLSRDAKSNAGYMSKEIALALSEAEKKPKGSQFVVPVRLDNCTVPKRLASLQWADLFAEDGYEQLAKTMREGAVPLRPAAAIVAFNRRLERNPNDKDALLQLGIARGNLGHLEAAIQSFDAAVHIDREFFPAWLERGLAYTAWADDETGWTKSSLGRKALESFDRAVEIQPEDGYAFLHRGECHSLIFNDERRALDDFAYAQRINPKDAQAFFAAGLSLGKLRRHRDAIQRFDAAIEIDKDFPEAHFWRGYSHYELKMYSQALADFEAELLLNDRDARAFHFRGKIKKNAGDVAGGNADIAKGDALGYDW